MKHAYWFRFVLRGLGIVFMVLALAALLPRTAEYIHEARHERMLVRTGQAFGDSDLKLVFLVEAAPAALQLAIGLYLLIGGRWIVDLCIPPDRPYCPECGYDRSESGNAAACAECGASLPAPASRPKSVESS